MIIIQTNYQTCTQPELPILYSNINTYMQFSVTAMNEACFKTKTGLNLVNLNVKVAATIHQVNSTIVLGKPSFKKKNMENSIIGGGVSNVKFQNFQRPV